jgi:hypothetical protein
MLDTVNNVLGIDTSRPRAGYPYGQPPALCVSSVRDRAVSAGREARCSRVLRVNAAALCFDEANRSCDSPEGGWREGRAGHAYRMHAPRRGVPRPKAHSESKLPRD